MKQKVVVLGAGRVGKVIAADLSHEFDVTSADMNQDALAFLASRYPVKTRVADLGNPQAVAEAIEPADLVVSAVPGFMGFNTLETIIEHGKNVVDISFFAEDAFDLDELAGERGVIAAVDCGVAPGTPDYLAGSLIGQMQIDDFEFLIGGLHFRRSGPDQYLPTFSPSDVWEEYTRPARYVRDGKLVTMPPLSEPELVEFRIGGHELTLEAFNTDGLRTLITTMNGRIPEHAGKDPALPRPHRLDQAPAGNRRDLGFGQMDAARGRGRVHHHAHQCPRIGKRKTKEDRLHDVRHLGPGNRNELHVAGDRLFVYRRGTLCPRWLLHSARASLRRPTLAKRPAAPTASSPT